MNRVIAIALAVVGLVAGSPRVAWGVITPSSPEPVSIRAPGEAPAIPCPGERRAGPQRMERTAAPDCDVLAARLPCAAPSLARPHASRIDETQPTYLKIRLRGTPKNHRSPPV